MIERDRGWNILTMEKLRKPPEAFAALTYCVLFLLIFVVVCIIFISISKMVSDILSAKEGAGSDAAKNLLFAIGAILAAPFVVWRAWVVHQQWRVGVEQVSIQAETLSTSLLTKAMEMLGQVKENTKEQKNSNGVMTSHSVTEKVMEARIGGILILKRIAINSKYNNKEIIDIMSEYIKSNSENLFSRIENEQNSEFDCSSDEPYLRSPPDVSMCIKSLLDIVEVFHESAVEIGEAVFSGVDFSNRQIVGIDFKDCYFVNCIFDNSSVQNCIIDGSRMMGCRLHGTDLSECTIINSTNRRFSFVDENTKFPSEFEFIMAAKNEGIIQYSVADSYFRKRR